MNTNDKENLTDQITCLNAEKNQLLSDLLKLREDYDRVCEKLNLKEAELESTKKNLKVALTEQKQEITKLKLEFQKQKN